MSSILTRSKKHIYGFFSLLCTLGFSPSLTAASAKSINDEGNAFIQKLKTKTKDGNIDFVRNLLREKEYIKYDDYTDNDDVVEDLEAGEDGFSSGLIEFLFEAYPSLKPRGQKQLSERILLGRNYQEVKKNSTHIKSKKTEDKDKISTGEHVIINFLKRTKDENIDYLRELLTKAKLDEYDNDEYDNDDVVGDLRDFEDNNSTLLGFLFEAYPSLKPRGQKELSARILLGKDYQKKEKIVSNHIKSKENIDNDDSKEEMIDDPIAINNYENKQISIAPAFVFSIDHGEDIENNSTTCRKIINVHNNRVLCLTQKEKDKKKMICEIFSFAQLTEKKEACKKAQCTITFQKDFDDIIVLGGKKKYMVLQSASSRDFFIISKIKNDNMPNPLFQQIQGPKIKNLAIQKTFTNKQNMIAIRTADQVIVYKINPVNNSMEEIFKNKIKENDKVVGFINSTKLGIMKEGSNNKIPETLLVYGLDDNSMSKVQNPFKMDFKQKKDSFYISFNSIIRTVPRPSEYICNTFIYNTQSNKLYPLPGQILHFRQRVAPISSHSFVYAAGNSRVASIVHIRDNKTDEKYLDYLEGQWVTNTPIGHITSWLGLSFLLLTRYIGDNVQTFFYKIQAK